MLRTATAHQTPPVATDHDPGAPRPRRRSRSVAIVSLVAAAIAVLAVGCGGSTPSDQTGTTQARGAQSNTTVATSEKPKAGGSIIYGLEAESDGFDPTQNRWAIAGVMVGLAVYDPLAAYNDKVEAKPYLAKEFVPNATYTEWTVKLRDGIKFSNGTPLTSAAIKKTFDKHLTSPLTKPVFSPVDTITTPDDMTVVFKMKSPWVVFPTTLTAQTGVIPEPSTLDADASGTTPAAATPIGTGPFTQVSWQKDNSWKGKKNATYWRKDEFGQQMPYLDNLEFRPIPEVDPRGKSLEAGTIQMMHTNQPDSIVHFRELAAQGKVQMVEDNGEGEEGFVIMNNQKAPFDSLDARRALAYATDADGYNDTVNESVFDTANGVFRTNSPWYAETKNYPGFDIAKATELVDKYKNEHGGQAPSFKFGITKDNTTEAAYLQQTWQSAGFQVEIEIHEQAQFILEAVSGKYQANLWRQFGAPDPDADYLWWTSANAGDGPEGGLTLNIARHKSPDCVDPALKKGRETADLAARKKAYADLQQCFADEVPYVWLEHTVWSVVAAPNVRGITNGPLPDGQPSLPIGGAGDFGGVTRLTQTWLAA